MENISLSVLDEDLLKVVTAFRPKIIKQGEQWLCYSGENLQQAISAYGDTPINAVYKFWLQLYKP